MERKPAKPEPKKELQRHFASSEELCEYMADLCGGTCLLAFSRGKDSIASWLQLRKYFKRVVAYHLYFIPDLDFVNNSLAYYEEFFGQKIYKFPHQGMYKYLIQGIDQSPHRFPVIEEANAHMLESGIENFDFRTIDKFVRGFDKTLENAYCASGVRVADGPIRAASVKKNGAVSHKQKTFFPIYDWLKADIVRELDASGVYLPPDYDWMGRTYDGHDYRFIEPIKRNAPSDYAKILDWFPNTDADIVRINLRTQYFAERETK